MNEAADANQLMQTWLQCSAWTNTELFYCKTEHVFCYVLSRYIENRNTGHGYRFWLHVLNSKPGNEQVGSKVSSSYNLQIQLENNKLKKQTECT